MDEENASQGDGGIFTQKSIVAACIIISRFLQNQHPEFGAYLRGALATAAAAGLSDADLEFVRLIVRSIGA